MIQPDAKATAFPTIPTLTGADVHEDHGFFVVHAELSGIDGNHLGVVLDHGDLVVSGAALASGLGFYRRLPLPFEVDGAADFQFSAGLLEVRIPIPDEDGADEAPFLPPFL